MLSGSLTLPGQPGDARDFYAGLDVRPVDLTEAYEAADPMRGRPADAPVLRGPRRTRPTASSPSLDDAEYERQVAGWARALQSVGAARADVLHLHHLTPLTRGRARGSRRGPGRRAPARHRAADARGDRRREPDRWAHGEAWAERMRDWAAGCERLIVLTDSQIERAEQLLGVDADRFVVVPNGFDPELFVAAPRRPPRRSGAAHLVDEPQGWRPGERAGSVRYTEADLEAFGSARDETPVLLYVGRFTEVKRIGAADRGLRPRPAAASPRRAPLVLVGGFPGEWEGEHPLDAIRRDRRRGRLPRRLARATTSCPSFLAASDVVVLPSVREQFGQVLVEGMACGAARRSRSTRFGPAEIVRPRRDGLARRARRPDRAGQRAGRGGQPAVERRRRGRARPPTRASASPGPRSRARSPRSTTSRAASSPRSCSPAPDPRRSAGTGCGRCQAPPICR